MINKIIPTRLKSILKPYWYKYRILKVTRNHKEEVRKVGKKSRIKVAFFLIYESIWKYEKLYFLLKADPRFEPVVFACPFLTFGEEIMKEEMSRAYKSFTEKGYTIVKTLKKNGSWLDVKKEFAPDLVFFTNPWNPTKPQYRITNFLNSLTCYVPYGFNSSNLYQAHFNRDMQNFCWKVFTETAYHKKLAKKYSPRKGKNFIVTGYPGVDNLIDRTYYPQQQTWKFQTERKKRIIWAPHHTIPNTTNLLDYSTFLTYADFMLDVAKRYEDKIQICFKPHPNLKGKLINGSWGKEKTEEYYNTWKTLGNGQLSEGDYIDLFLDSDALIHDCGSFLLEYLYTKKPVMFLIDDEGVREQFNELGKQALQIMNIGYNKEDIIRFIEQNVILENDDRCEGRKEFVEDYLIPPNNRLSSENIYDHLLECITIK